MRHRRRFGMLAGCLVVGVVGSFLLATPFASGHRLDVALTSYNHDDGGQQLNADWMKNLPSDELLSQVSMPGTHDSGTYMGYPIVDTAAAQTQSMALPTQLNAGIRALDIRLSYGLLCNSAHLWVYHGIWCQNLRFEDVLRYVGTWLSSHPTETVVMRLRNEDSSPNDSVFETMVKDDVSQVMSASRVYLPALSDLGDAAKKSTECPSYTPGWARFGDLSKCSLLDPPLQAVRGKLVIFMQLNGAMPSPGNWAGFTGLPYESQLKCEQDQWKMPNYSDIDKKWTAVVQGFTSANTNCAPPNGVSSGTYYFFNYLSASSDSAFAPFPYFYASGKSGPANDAPPRERPCTAPAGFKCHADPYEGINDRASAYLQLNQGCLTRVGIVYSDFPGAALIDAIIDVNPALRQAANPRGGSSGSTC